MALHALKRRVRSGKRIVRINRMVEVDVRPVGGVVAGLAGGRERRGSMVRICRALPVRLVAAVARRRQGCLVIVCMALRARLSGVCANEREHRRMIERGRCPVRGGMA